MGLPSLQKACQVCKFNKAALLPFKDEFKHVSRPLVCVHIDLIGPIFPSSISSSQYFLTIVYQFTSFKTVCLLKTKSDVFEQFVIVKNLMENLHNQKLKKLVSDRGGEFVNHRFTSLENSKGFVHHFSPAETPQHNGFAKRANRTILEKAGCLLNGSNLPRNYWAESVLTATILCNLILNPSGHNLSPYAMCKGVPPCIKKLQTFSCRAIVTLSRTHCEWKLAPTGVEGILLGYENDNTSYQILHLSDRKVIISSHVTFDENCFPSLQVTSAIPLTITWGASRMDSGLVDEVQPDDAVVVDKTHSAEIPAPCLDVPNPPAGPHTFIEEPLQVPRHIKVIGPWHPTLINRKINTQNILPFSHCPKVFLTTSDDTPPAFKSALNSPASKNWSEAINQEFSSMKKLQVWDVVELEPRYKLVGTTWVFKTKRDPQGNII
ncbi:hypothetical protein O181_066571 [Austropuccinia psidii MF-1]|uniref:Integrase catalytic domain-containing protein n=1 Tax=Austropuccinia psidii MF-1 TaxID=1389203 RepID=A0A9Q3I2B1_9BASI|nr:hypothetical protein [Austropuccinia psidii MF-1]